MRRRYPGRWWVAGLACLVAFAGVGFVACDDDEGATIEEVEEIGEDGAADSDVTIGETVTLSGEVEELLAPNAIILAGRGGLFIEEPQVLVVSSEAIPVEEAQPVEVTGTVRRFVLADVEEEFGVDLDDEDAFIAELEGEPYIVADEIEAELFEE